MSTSPNPEHRADGPDIHRTLPHSLEAEKGLLGSMFIAPLEVMDDCVQRVSAGDFYQPTHQTIFALLVELWEKQHPADLVTLTQTLRERKQLDAVGGAPYLTSLIDFTPTAANARYYADFVLEASERRQLITVCTGIVTRAYGDARSESNAALLDEAESGVLAIRDAATKDAETSTMKDNVVTAIETIEQLYERRGQPTGLVTGFSELDRMTSGLSGPNMYVIAARPSMGKTALAMNIVEHVALAGKRPVAVFSLEMSTQQLTQRLLCSIARVNLQKMRDGFLSERDFPNLTNAASRLADTAIHIDDSHGLSIGALRARARRMKRKHQIELIVVDYLQLLRSPTKRAQENRQLEISEISSGLKAMAKELNLPVIVLAQLNRNPEARKGGRPRLSDLRESGSIEQDADFVGLLSRAEYYADNEEQKEELRGEAILDVAKQRSGPTDEVKLTFLKEFTRFEDRAEESAAGNVRDLG